MFIQVIENLNQDLCLRKIDLTTDAIQFYVFILIKLYDLNIGYYAIILKELKKLYDVLNQTIQSQF